MKRTKLRTLSASLVLAITTTAILPSVSAVQAASPHTLSAEAVTIYNGSSYDFNINNANGKIYTYSYATQNSKVVTIDKTGVIKAKGTGNTKITCKIINKSTKKLAKTLTATVAVVDKMALSKTNVSLQPGAVQSIAVNNTIADFYSYQYTSQNPSVATVSADTGLVTAVGEGTTTITCTVTNKAMKKSNKLTATVTVAAPQFSFIAKQAKSDTLLLSLATAVQSVEATDITIKDSYGAPIYVKSATLSSDKKSIEVVTYSEFEDGQVYTVTYKEKSTTFSSKIGAPVRVVLQNQTIKTGIPTKIKISVFDANGVDITSNDLLSKISLTMESSNGYINDTGTVKEITLYAPNQPVVVTAKYNSGIYDTNGVESVINSNKATFVASDSIKEVVNFSAYSVATTVPTDWSKVSHTVPGNSSNYKLYVKVTGEDGMVIDDVVTYESLDTNVLVVDDNGGIYPMKQGTGYVRATVRGKSTTCQIIVAANSKISNITVEPTTVTLSRSLQDSNGSYISDEQKVKVLVKDQYGNNVTTDTELSAETTKNSPAQVILGSSSFAGDTLTLSSADFIVDGTYYLNVIAANGNDRLTRPVTVIVRSTTNSIVSSYRPTLSTANVDVQDILSTKTPALVTAGIDGINSSGIKVQKVNVTEYVITDPKGNTVNKYNGDSFITISGNDVSFGLPNNGRMQLPMLGSYKIRMKYNAANGQKEATLVVTVKNSAAAPVVKVESTSVTLESYESADQAKVIGNKALSAVVNGRAAQSVALHNYKVNNSKGRLEPGDSAYITIYSVRVTDEDGNEHLCALTNNQTIRVVIKK